MQLAHYTEFKEALSKYTMSDRAKATLNDLHFVLLVAPTSTGRNTIIRHQLKTGKYYYIVSDTTRSPRINDGVPEQNGVQYWFRSEEEILADLKAGEFLEAELIHDQQVSGISIRELEKAKAENKTAITDVDLAGIHNVLAAKPAAVAVMLLPPSYEEWQRRIASRGRMSEQERRRRLETAQKIFEDGLKQDYYHFVIAENIEQSAALVDAIASGGTNPHQDRGKTVIKQLLDRLSAERS